VTAAKKIHPTFNISQGVEDIHCIDEENYIKLTFPAPFPRGEILNGAGRVQGGEGGIGGIRRVPYLPHTQRRENM